MGVYYDWDEEEDDAEYEAWFRSALNKIEEYHTKSPLDHVGTEPVDYNKLRGKMKAM
jgi:hypothetical protein